MKKSKRVLLYLFAIVFFYWVFFHLKSAIGGEISADLAAQLARLSQTEEVSALIYLKQPVNSTQSASAVFPPQDRKEVYRTVLGSLQKNASSSQSELLTKLEGWQMAGAVSRFKSFWVANAIAITARREAIQELAVRPEVEMLYPDYKIELVAPVEEKVATSGQAAADKVQTAIGAKQVRQQGLTGKGRLVCLLDSGVDGGHPALSSAWRGRHASLHESWWDPFGTNFPQDAAGHGTHVAGIICAKTDSDTIGVAPEAEWIAAAVVDRGTSKDVTVSSILDAFQWAINPDGDTSTMEDVPDVINNSWGFPKSVYPDCAEIFWQAIDNLEGAGIVVVFAAGNEGPGPYTLRVPADRSSSPYNSFSVGAVAVTDTGFEIASFSSRGPSRCDSTKAKPELTGPGVEIYSTYPNGQYRLMSGTSMAVPFISAAVLILRQLDPDISVEEIKQVLMETATDRGTPGRDNDYGAGVVNIAAAVDYWRKIKGLDGPAVVVPQDFRLEQNFPNPFNASTTIKYEVKPTGSSAQDVKLKIYNILGQQVRTLVEGPQKQGFYTVSWDGKDKRGDKVASGIYFYSLQAGEFVQTRKMAFLK